LNPLLPYVPATVPLKLRSVGLLLVPHVIADPICALTGAVGADDPAEFSAVTT
jgi:hypothetical protein